jgi:YggT family protein
MKLPGSLRLLTPFIFGWVVLVLSLGAAPASGIAIPRDWMQSANVLSKTKSRKEEVSSLALSRSRLPPLAMAIPGYGIAEQVLVGGFGNFLSIFNAIVTVRVLLSWFPQAQGVALLQPIYAVTDPYLNIFRGIIPPIAGFDISPLVAFFALNVAGQATAAVGCELPPALKQRVTAASDHRSSPFQLHRKPHHRVPGGTSSSMAMKL